MKILFILLCILISIKAHSLTQEERKQLFKESIERLKGTGIEKKVPQVGQTFPDIKLSDKKISEWVKTGPLLFVVYRGGWCPYCVKQLKELESNMDRFKAQKVSIIAMAPETEQEVRKTKSKNNLSFNLASDKNGKILKELGLTFRVEDKVEAEYKTFGINLAENQGNTSQELPVPVTYLIDKNMKIQYAYIDADYTKRPSVEEIFNSLKP